MQNKALDHFEQAFIVYENFNTYRQNHESSILLADAAMQVANIMEAQNRLNDSLKYV